MTKRTFLMLILLGLMLTYSQLCAVEIYVGNPDSTLYTGTNVLQNMLNGNSVTQTIYLNSEIPTDGVITHIQYRYHSINGTIRGPRRFQFYMATRPASLTQFTGNSNWVSGDEFTLVFDGYLDVNIIGIHDFLIELDTPYVYKTGALVMASTRFWHDTANWSNDAWQYTEATNRTLSRHSNTEQLTIFNTLSGTRSPNVPNITFVFDSGARGHITGTITGGNPAVPIAGATVHINGTKRTAITNANGVFLLEYVPIGSISITASMIGFYDLQLDNITTNANQTTTQNIVMTALPRVSVSGRVLGSDTNLPIAWGTVYVDGYAYFGGAITMADGTFTINDVYGDSNYILVPYRFPYVSPEIPIFVGNSNLNIGDIFVYEETSPPRHVTANGDGNKIVINWMEPYVENASHPSPFSTGSNQNSERMNASRAFEYIYNIYRVKIDDSNWYTNESEWTTLVTNYAHDGDGNLSFSDSTIEDANHGHYRYIVKSVYTNGNLSSGASSNAIAKMPELIYSIGDPNSTYWLNGIPISVASESAVSQTLYYAEEINNVGDITGIVLNLQSSGMISPDNMYHFWMAETEKEVFNNLSDWIPFENFTHVFSGKIPMLAEPGIFDVIINFDNPFNYQNGNIVIMGHKSYYTHSQFVHQFTATQTPGINRAIVHLSLREDLSPPFNTYPDARWLQPGYANIGFVFNSNNRGHVLGTVFDSESGSPIQDVLIKIEGTNINTSTNQLGEYQLFYVQTGDINIEASKKGFFSKIETDVQVYDQSTTTRDIILTPIPVLAVSGKVTGANTDQGLSNASVVISGYEDYEFLTDEEGYFTIPGVYSNMTYSISIRKLGYQPFYNPFLELGIIDLDLGLITLVERDNPPRNVFAFNQVTNAMITWIPPSQGVDSWITQMDSEDFEIAFGAQNGVPFNAIVLHRFSNEQLETLGVNSGELTKIAFHINNTNANIKLAVYTGGSANPIMPGTRVLEQPVNQLVIGFNEVNLAAPIKIPSSGDLWVGYEIEFLGGGFPISVSAGTQNTLFGDIFYWGPTAIWQNLGDNNPFNFMIKAYVEGGIGAVPRTRVTQGYNIYFSNVLTIDNEMNWNTIATGITDLEYLDTTWKDAPIGFYRYIVKAIYSNDILSEPAFSDIIERDIITDEDDSSDLPEITALNGNYPNPFNPRTTILFDIAKETNIKIDIFNIRGQKVNTVIDDFVAPGRYRVEWDGVDSYGRMVATGVYFYQMTTDDYNSIKRMLLMK